MDTDATDRDLQTAYATLMTQVKSGFGGALEVVTPELIEEFRFHTETKLKKAKKQYKYGLTESIPQFRTRIWLTCLRDDLAALGGFFEIKKETEECEREIVLTEDMTDSELDAAIERQVARVRVSKQKVARLKWVRDGVVGMRERRERGEQPFTDSATQQQITNTVSLFREYLESLPREAFTKLYSSSWSYTLALSDFQAWTLGYTESGIKHDMSHEEGLLFEHYLLYDIGCKNNYDAEMSNTFARVRSI